MASCKAQLQASRRASRRRGYLAVIRAIDGITQWTGYVFTLLVAPLIVANVVEVFMRYVMNAPTSWALDVTTMSYGALFMLGAAYALLKGAHVRTDMLWEKFSDRKKGIIDSVAYVLFFLPSMAILFAISIDDFFYSLSINEKSTSGIWQPVIWPLRAVIPAGRGAAVPARHLRADEERVGRPHRRGSGSPREDRGLSRR